MFVHRVEEYHRDTGERAQVSNREQMQPAMKCVQKTSAEQIILLKI